tara:strand:+ start:262 stop:633 length:372 start_codon:yes stop_codon:yes gene_type:complete
MLDNALIRLGLLGDVALAKLGDEAGADNAGSCNTGPIGAGVTPLVSGFGVGITGADIVEGVTGGGDVVAIGVAGALYPGGVAAIAPAFAVVGDVVTLGVSNAPAAGIFGVPDPVLNARSGASS